MKNNRRKFLKLFGHSGLVLAGGALFKPTIAVGAEKSTIFKSKSGNMPKQRFNMSGYGAPKLDVVRVGIIGLKRGRSHLSNLIKIENVEIKAICDLLPENIEASKKLLDRTKQTPTIYTGSDEAWKELCNSKDIDLIYIATPWNLHAPMALYAMDHGKHVGIEVPAATTIEDCWKLVETSERNRKHCMVLENYCYRLFELLVLNMVRNGFYGEIVSADGAYLHNILGNITNKNFKWNMWRLKENFRIGHLYPTHGLGPVAQTLDINRGDSMDYMVSMSSNDFVLEKRLKELRTKDNFYEPFLNKTYRGNTNTSIIRTKKGKLITLQHDVTSPNVFSTIYKVVGTKGTALKYPLPEKISDGGEDWLSAEEMKLIENKYQPPIVKKLGETAMKLGGHGGGDFLMNWRLIDCLRNGLPIDIDVYDTASWSVIAPLSERSVAYRSIPVDIPDFTDGQWETNKPLDILLEKGGNTKIIV